MKLPNKIEPCPIVDALFEIRFSSNLPPNAVFGVVYNSIKDRYPETEDLPILQIPEPIRRVDNSFRFKPLYKAQNDDFVVQVGPDVLTISSYPKYIGWDKYHKELLNFFSTLNSLKITTELYRIGYHVVNFFEENIFRNLKIKISIADNEIEYSETNFKTSFYDDNNQIRTILQVANNSRFKEKPGSIIDIDSFTQFKLDDFFENTEKILTDLHEQEKMAFFSLLKEDFLETLSPEYNNEQ